MTSQIIRCAAALLVAGATCTSAHAAEPAAPTFTQTVLQNSTYPGHGYYTKLVLTEIPPGVVAPRHTHPGLEATYVTKGAVTLIVEGQPDHVYKAGDSFAVPASTAHLFKNGAEASELVTTYVLEEGQPPVHKLP
jgi:quercetin dioxygenase-like cupin family protein